MRQPDLVEVRIHVLSVSILRKVSRWLEFWLCLAESQHLESAREMCHTPNLTHNAHGLGFDSILEAYMDFYSIVVPTTMQDITKYMWAMFETSN